jgi:arylsulfatase A-like enzyme
MGKQSLYEHSMKAPLFVSGPGIPKGESEALVYLYDIFPTVCDLNGIDVPQGLDGQSLAGIISGKQKSVRKTLFTSYKQFMRSVRDDRWKLIRYPHINRSQLFDLENDPHELKDLAGSAEGKERITRLMAEMSAWQKKIGDTQPLTSENPRDETFTPPKSGSQKKRPRKKKRKPKK